MIVFVVVVIVALFCSQITNAQDPCHFQLDDVSAVENAGRICASLSFLPPRDEHGNMDQFDIRLQTLAVNLTYSILGSEKRHNKKGHTTLSNNECFQELRVFHLNRNRSRTKLYLCGPLTEALYSGEELVLVNITDTLFEHDQWGSVNCTVHHKSEMVIERRNISHPNACAETNMFCPCMTSCQSFSKGEGGIYSCRYPMSFQEIIPDGSVSIMSPSGRASFVDEWNAVCIDLRFELSSDVEYVTLRRPPSYRKPTLTIAASSDPDIPLHTSVIDDGVVDTCTNAWEMRLNSSNIVHMCSKVDEWYKYMLPRLVLGAPEKSVVEYSINMLGGGYQQGVLSLKDIISSLPIEFHRRPLQDVCDAEGVESICSQRCISSCTALLRGDGPVWCHNRYRGVDKLKMAASRLLTLQ